MLFDPSRLKTINSVNNKINIFEHIRRMQLLKFKSNTSDKFTRFQDPDINLLLFLNEQQRILFITEY